MLIFIFSFIAFIILLCTLLSWYTMSQPNKNIIFGVTVPYEMLKSEEIITLSVKFKKLCYRYLSLIIITFIPILFIPLKYPSIFIIYLFVWILFYCLFIVVRPYTSINKELMALKKQNSWFCGNVREITIDTAASRLKNKKIIPPHWFIGATAIPIISFVLEFITNLKTQSNLFFLLINLSIKATLFLLYFGVKKLKTKAYSENSAINVTLNCERQRFLSLTLVIIAYIDSITFFITYYMLCTVNYSVFLLFLISILSILLIIALVYYFFRRFSNLKKELIEYDNNPILIDDDEYYIHGLIYYNPYDNSLFVEKRAGIGMTINFATFTGKLITFGTIIFTGIIVLAISLIALYEDFTPTSINISNSGDIAINCPLYNMKFDASDITDISLINSIPSGNKTNGADTDEYSRGYYDLDKYGSCKLYIYNNNAPYILIKLKDTYVIYNEKNRNTTLELYTKLKKLKA